VAAGGSFPVIAMAASAGGLKALSVILGGLPADFPAALAIVMHLAPERKSLLAEILSCRTSLEVKQAQTGDRLCPSQVFIAPPNHHLSVGKDGRLALSSSASKKVHHARPSAEPLFASVAEVYQQQAIAVVLTGGDGDGSFGVQIIKEKGGKVIAQDRPTSQDFSMPNTSIKTGDVDFILPLDQIAPKLIELVGVGRRQSMGRTPPETKAAMMQRRGGKTSSVPRRSVPTSEVFPIVGIGASAGGLEALEQFLGHVPAGSGMALVIVQHLDPTHKGIMPELLQRATGMKVLQVKDRTKVKPNYVYVIPPNKDMSILHGILHLLEPAAPRGLRLPIDFFLRSLAQDQQEHSIGVILSGMGSDGTLGLRAIKEKAGVVLVQEPATAKFDGMPRSAVDAGLADIVAPVEALPGKIMAYLQRTPLITRTATALEDKSQSALEKAVILLRAHTGHDFSLYKRNTLYRRIERRMGIHQIAKMSNYVRYLQENSQELDLLFKELLIGVTNFFRDPAAWEQLGSQAIPALLANRSPSHTMRAWVPGCSTGEEAYSLAIAFKEAVEQTKPKGNFALQIFATDLDQDAIAKARQGFFPDNIAADVSPERLGRYFAKEDGGYRVRKEIREMVIFAPQNLIMDPPFTKLDFLSCRNLLIYLAPEMQKKLMPLFHYSLNPGGLLFLGSAETIGSATDLFTPLSGPTRLFRRTESTLRPEPVEFPSSFSAPPANGPEARPAAKPPLSLQSLADQLVLQHYAPPAVLVNDKGDIFYISGRTGKYLEPAAGKANWNIFAMAREGLRYELSGAFQKALRSKGSVLVRGLKLGTNGGEQCVDVAVQRLEESGPLQGLVMIVFTDVAAPVAAKAAVRTSKAQPQSARLAEMGLELERVRAEARATHEEMQTSQEEFRSANEELQSTNEELQSTNEELTTSKEEMQSLNEELQTLNTELQAKVDELARASNDMKNLLNSTDIATLFLDNNLNVRRFTAQATKIIKLIPADEGRPITDLASELCYPELAEDTREVLRTLASAEKPISARDGRWFTVRIMPYRTLDDRIDGVVITFADITAAKTLEAKLRAKHAGLEKQVLEGRRK
jgi:two-component system CheB/CheR fusion protein